MFSWLKMHRKWVVFGFISIFLALNIPILALFDRFWHKFSIIYDPIALKIGFDCIYSLKIVKIGFPDPKKLKMTGLRFH